MDNKQYVVFGLGHFGMSVAQTLYKLGYDVLAIDQDEELVQKVSNSVTHAVTADATDEDTLKSLGIRNFDVAIIGMGSDMESSIIVTMLVKELGIKYIVAKALNELQAKVLYNLGADRVVFPEKDMGIRVAHNLVSSNILEYIELSPDYSIAEIVASKQWEGKTLGSIDIRSKYGINVVAIKTEGGVNVSPSANDVIHCGDMLIVIGGVEELNKIERMSKE